MVELREARKVASKIGLGLQYVLKEARVFDIWAKLSPVIISEEIAPHATLICKGGTALNKVFLKDIQRFSEDLDFDAFFTKEISKKEKIEFLEKHILSHLKNSYQIEEPRLMRDVVRFTCNFINEMDAKDCVFVEFNIQPKGPMIFEIRKAKSEILDIAPVEIPVYTFPVLVAKKIKTFYERGSGKDLYDIFYSLKIAKEIKEIVDAFIDVLPKAMTRKLIRDSGLSGTDRCLAVVAWYLQQNGLNVSVATEDEALARMRREFDVKVR